MDNAALAKVLRKTPGEVLVPTKAGEDTIHVRAHKGDLIDLLAANPTGDWWDIGRHQVVARNCSRQTYLIQVN